MTKRIVLSAAFVGILVSAALATAHAGHEHKAMGTVAAVDAKHIEVADKDGKKTSFQLTPETKYRHGTMAAEASHVTVGQRVVVIFVQNEKDKTNVAKQVLLGVTEKDAAPAKPHGHH
jgi:uncharacterized lipoprotein NlpE involved in copper resistance